MFFKWILFFCFTQVIHAQFLGQCEMPRLAHGKVRGRQNRKLIKFTCNVGYELVGNRYATCRAGEWDIPQPVCVRPSRDGCPIPNIDNGVRMVTRGDAWVVFFCLPGYKLVGSTAIYCDGKQWNTTKPSCVDANIPPKLTCDFENPDLCGWAQDSLHDFDWERLNRKTPSSFLSTGPNYDHTYGEGKSGYYMYIESSSRLQNETARLISPVFDSKLAVNGCFAFYYHMFGRDIGGLRVYQKPDSAPLELLLGLPDQQRQKYLLFDLWGNQGDFWYGDVLELYNFGEDFQIVVEGIRGKKFTSDIAIDDVAILQGENCSAVRSVMATPPPLLPESCEGRCGNASQTSRGCSCEWRCLMDNNCCRDYIETCLYKEVTTTEETDKTTPDPPQTEKLVAKSTTVDATTELTTTIKPSPPKVTVRVKLVNTTKRAYSPPVPANPPTPPTQPTKPTAPTSTSTLSTKPITTKLTPPKPTQTTPKPTTTSQSTPKLNLPTPKTPAITKNVTFQKDAIIDAPKTSTKLPQKPIPTPKTNSGTNGNGRKAKIVSTDYFRSKSPITPDYPKKTSMEKEKKELSIQSKGAKLQAQGKSSAWKPILITLAVLMCSAGLAWLVIQARGARGRQALAMWRRKTTNDPEVRYLHTDQDDD